MDYLLNLIKNMDKPQPAELKVLNLIINGLPSKQRNIESAPRNVFGFKPYYKWITF